MEIAAVTVSVPDAAQLIGVGRTTLYQLLSSGEIESVFIGGRRVVVVQSVRDFVDRLRAEQNAGRTDTTDTTDSTRALGSSPEPTEPSLQQARSS